MKNEILVLCILTFQLGCSSSTQKFNETIGQGEDAVRVRYKKPKTDLNLPKTAVVSCDSECRNSITQVYEFEHIESDADVASCKYHFSVPCYPYSCDSNRYSCATSCTANEHCSIRAICDQESKQCVPAISAAEIADSKAAHKARESKKIAIPPAPTATPVSAIEPLNIHANTQPDALPAPAPYNGKLSPEATKPPTELPTKKIGE